MPASTTTTRAENGVLAAKVSAGVQIGTLILTIFIAPMMFLTYNTIGDIQEELENHNLRISMIEQTRFTTKMGLEIQTQIADINKRMAELPPREWRARIRAMELWLAQHNKDFRPPVDPHD